MPNGNMTPSITTTAPIELMFSLWRIAVFRECLVDLSSVAAAQGGAAELGLLLLVLVQHVLRLFARHPEA